MRHARVSATLNSKGQPGRVHAIPPYVQRNIKSSLCGALPTSGVADPEEVGRWRGTDEPVDCQRCLARLERVVDAMLEAGVLRIRGYELVVDAPR